jgi:hypothetical protein
MNLNSKLLVSTSQPILEVLTFQEYLGVIKVLIIVTLYVSDMWPG